VLKACFSNRKEAMLMNGPAQYLHFGFILISLANVLVIALLIVVFLLAVALRLPEKQHLSTLEEEVHPDEAMGKTEGHA
jgi:large-conductance mechanosensitive channel